MSHKFDFKKRDWLDSAERQKYLPPGRTLNSFGLKEGDIFVDIGAGIGFFSLPAAEMVGRDGFVYALDISREMLAEIDKKIKAAGLANIKTVKSQESKFPLGNATASFAFTCNVLHEVKDLELFLAEIKRILAPPGKIAIIDWKKQETLINGEMVGPPVKHRLDFDYLVKKLKDTGFGDIREVTVNEHLYGILGHK